ncbi:Rrf2 family transcriptional regulator [Paenibacillus sp. GCM10027628]|uniref:Rrf2 family transcriptional regulator n=1 Tax=Paenibacillus sp. GCM10027628 TaxID=3273413 RepID=UPI003638EE4E
MSAPNRFNQIGPPRFNIAIHILVWLAKSGCVLSSAMIAEQVNSHSTFLRRVLALLAQAGVVEAREGRDGGYTLKMRAEEITLDKVYLAVKAEAAESEVKSDCGKPTEELDAALEEIMKLADRQTIEYLKKYNIAELCAYVKCSD